MSARFPILPQLTARPGLRAGTGPSSPPPSAVSLNGNACTTTESGNRT
jgi:hypothetical protein